MNIQHNSNRFDVSNASAFASPLVNASVGFDNKLPAIDTRSSGLALSVSWADMISQREYLVRFAQRRLLDPALAEDAVHDVFEAVMSGRAVFEGRSALRSWLTAILKNKVVDIIRQRARYGSLQAPEGAEGEFDTDDCIGQIACSHARPDELAEQRELLAHTLGRIDSLAPGLRDVMQFRVLQDESSEAVCARLQISEASLFVRLHRARKQLLN